MKGCFVCVKFVKNYYFLNVYYTKCFHLCGLRIFKDIIVFGGTGWVFFAFFIIILNCKSFLFIICIMFI